MPFLKIIMSGKPPQMEHENILYFSKSNIFYFGYFWQHLIFTSFDDRFVRFIFSIFRRLDADCV